MIYDFIVVGGGMAGTSAGARLSQLGSVLLLEAEPSLGYHASGRSAALFETYYGLETTVALNIASREYHETDQGGVLSPRGLLFVGSADQTEIFAKDVVKMHLDRITVAEACKLVPILNPGHVAHAAYHEDAWDIDTDLLLQGFARQIRANGGIIKMGQRVDQIARDGALWRVTAGQDFEGRTLVNAAGAWADLIAVQAGITPLGLTPLRRSIARLPAPGGHDVSRWPMLIGAGESWYAKADAGGWLVSPAEEDPVTEPHDAWADDMVLAEGIERYQPFVTEDVTRVTSSWAGLRTFSPDRSLVLGPDLAQPNFIWCAGQGGYGIQTSPAASQLIADLVAGRPPALKHATVKALSPRRFAI
jgi:D-arginine dehydrogenase